MTQSKRTSSASHPSEGAVIAEPLPASSLAALLTAHVLRDGEVVLLLLKPSLWLIIFQSISAAATALLLYLIGRVFNERLPLLSHVMTLNLTIFIIGVRLMWATVVWMGRFYLLTDRRVVRVAGVFNIDIQDCALRKVDHTKLVYSIKERLCGVASIEIHPKESEDACPVNVWRTVPRPTEVREQIEAAVRRAQNGLG